MAVICPKPPFLPPRVLVSFVSEYFPFQSIETDSIIEFVCYDDRNYYISGTLMDGIMTETHEEFVIKFLNSTDSEDMNVVDGLTKLKKFLYCRGFTCPYPIPSLLPSKAENIVVTCSQLLQLIAKNQSSSSQTPKYPVHAVKHEASLSASAGLDVHYCMSVLVFVKGAVYSDEHHSPEFLHELGAYVGAMDQKMMEFSHVGLENRQMINWDLSYLLTRRSRKEAVIHDSKRSQCLDNILNDFERFIIPVMDSPQTKKGVLHNDINPLNVVLKKTSANSEFVISGIIDISDCVFGPYVFELGIAMAHYMMKRKDPVSYIKPFLHGYLSIFPLSQSSLDVLYYIIMGRLAQSLINAAYSSQLEPTNTYMQELVQSSWELMDTLKKVGKDDCYEVWELKNYMKFDW